MKINKNSEKKKKAHVWRLRNILMNHLENSGNLTVFKLNVKNVAY